MDNFNLGLLLLYSLLFHTISIVIYFLSLLTLYLYDYIHSIVTHSISITLVIVFIPSLNHIYCNSYDVQVSYSLPFY